MLEQQPAQGIQVTPPIAKQRHWYQAWWGVLILAMLLISGSIAVAIALAINKQVKVIKQEQLSPLYGLPQVKLQPADSGTPKMGSNEAPIKLTVFGDYGCQYTKREYPIIRDFLFKHSNDLQLIYRDFPVVTENSLQLALAGRCAGEQKMFWPMHDYMFEHQGEEMLKMIMNGAKALNLDLQLFYNCLKTEKYLPQIRKDLAEGLDLQLQGTPSIFINGYQLPAGEIPAEVLENIFTEVNKKN